MLALLFTAVLFLFWMFLGSAVLRVSKLNCSPLTALLLSPSIGLTVVLISVFSLSRFGLAVSSFARPLLFLACIFSLGSHLFRARDHKEVRILSLLSTVLPFFGIFFLALILSAWPFLQYGADWLSFANNDMANYSLLARRFMEHGFFDVPRAEVLFSGKHYEETFWLQGLLERPGSELVLAWISSLTGRAPTKCFMTFILSLHLCIISGGGALVSQVTGERKTTLLALFLLSVSPLLTFGALYQLLGQTAGLSIFLGASTLVAFSATAEGRVSLLVPSSLFSLLLCSLLLLYPEVLPFLAVSLLGFAALLFLHERQFPKGRTLISLFLPPLVFLPLILRSYLLGAVSFLFKQVHSGVTGYKQAADVFSQYLQPTGIGGLWGFFNIYSLVAEPLLSGGIILGIVLTLVLLFFSVFRAFRLDYLAISFLVMASVTGFLKYQNSAFGLYKMAMYLQAFLWTSLAVFLAKIPKRRGISLVLLPLLLLVLPVVLKTQYDYVASSRGEADRMNGTFCEIYKGSSTRILSELEQLSAELQGRSIVSDSSNLVLAKLQSSAFIGKKLSLPFFDLFPTKNRHLEIVQAPELNARETELHDAELDRVSYHSFDMKQEGERATSKFWMENNSQPEDGRDGPFSLLINTALQTPFNRRLYGLHRSNFSHLPWEAVRNHLIFIDSEFGRLYYSHDRERISLYQLEPDYFYPGKTMAGMGRNFVFQVIHPSPQVRLQLWMTASLKHDSNNLLPQAEAIGKTREPMKFRGRGSGRVFSPPLVAQEILHRFYLGLDLGVEGERWRDTRTGILKLFSSDIPSDPRRLTGFLRDISLISEKEYQTRKSPRELKDFPADLSHPNLEYSGIYEDGWLSEESSVTLDVPNANKISLLHLEGSIPQLSPESAARELRIFVDGTQRFEGQQELGDFSVRVPIPPGRVRRNITIHFSRAEPLPGDDMRPVAAKLRLLGLESSEQS